MCLLIVQLTLYCTNEYEKLASFCRCFIKLQKVRDSDDTKLATIGSNITRHWAASNVVALAALG